MANEQQKAPSLVDSTKEVLGGEEHREDAEELTSQDFSDAATNFQEKVAGAVQYVSDALKPSSDSSPGGGAENDPEVQEFRSAAAEATEGVRQAVDPKDNSGNKTGSNEKTVSDQASDAVKAVKEKVLPTAHAAGPDSGADNQDGLQQAKDSIVRGAQAVADRFTAPASGEASKQSQQTDTGAGLTPAARDAKDKVSEGASYIANRFTASPAGDGKSAGQSAEEAKQESGSFLSSLLPNSNQGEKSTQQGQSLGDKAQDKYDSAKSEANKTQDRIADQITPTTQEEADLSAGYIPSNTADLQK